MRTLTLALAALVALAAPAMSQPRRMGGTAMTHGQDALIMLAVALAGPVIATCLVATRALFRRWFGGNATAPEGA